MYPIHTRQSCLPAILAKDVATIMKTLHFIVAVEQKLPQILSVCVLHMYADTE